MSDFASSTRAMRVIGLKENEKYASTSKRSLFSASIIFWRTRSFSPSHPVSAILSRKAFLVLGSDQISRSSLSLLKSSGSTVSKRFRINSSTDKGFPSAHQKDVEIICCISRSFPSRSFMIIFFFLSGGSPVGPGPSTISSFGGFGPVDSVVLSIGSPSHSGSAK